MKFGHEVGKGIDLYIRAEVHNDRRQCQDRNIIRGKEGDKGTQYVDVEEKPAAGCAAFPCCPHGRLGEGPGEIQRDRDVRQRKYEDDDGVWFKVRIRPNNAKICLRHGYGLGHE